MRKLDDELPPPQLDELPVVRLHRQLLLEEQGESERESARLELAIQILTKEDTTSPGEDWEEDVSWISLEHLKITTPLLAIAILTLSGCTGSHSKPFPSSDGGYPPPNAPYELNPLAVNTYQVSEGGQGDINSTEENVSMEKMFSTLLQYAQEKKIKMILIPGNKGKIVLEPLRNIITIQTPEFTATIDKNMNINATTLQEWINPLDFLENVGKAMQAVYKDIEKKEKRNNTNW